MMVEFSDFDFLHFSSDAYPVKVVDFSEALENYPLKLEDIFQASQVELPIKRMLAVVGSLTGPIRSRKDLKGLELRELDLDSRGGDVVAPGETVIVEHMGVINIPDGYHGLVDTKSSIGRIFGYAYTKSCEGDNTLDPGFSGKLFSEFVSDHYHTRWRVGDTLNQLRITDGRMLDSNLLKLEYGVGFGVHDSTGELLPSSDVVDSDHLNMRMTFEHGWATKTASQVIDIREDRNLDPCDFFDPIDTDSKGYFVTDSARSYIISTSDGIRLGPAHAGYLEQRTRKLGHMSAHATAGFGDPGFGHKEPCTHVDETMAHLEREYAKNPWVIDYRIFERWAEQERKRLKLYLDDPVEYARIYGGPASHWTLELWMRCNKMLRADATFITETMIEEVGVKHPPVKIYGSGDVKSHYHKEHRIPTLSKFFDTKIAKDMAG